jgi:tetratricopeptide (TPR) repeat protein
LASATFFVYEQVLHHEFVNFDDDEYVTENPSVESGLSYKSIIWAFTTPRVALWHPLTMLSHMLDCQLFGTNPQWHHFVNLLFHIANVLLLFWVLKDMTGAVWRSAFVAAAFALHPLHVESVAWVAERKDVLSTLFWLLTMAAYLRYVRNGGAKWYVLTLLSFASGLMAKPMLVTLPFVLLLLDYWPLNRFQVELSVESGGKNIFSRLVAEKIPFIAFSILFSIIAFIAQQSEDAIRPLLDLPLNVRIANALISYLKYIEKMVWPSRLAVLYPLHSNKLSMWQTAAASLLLLIISILTVRSAKNHKYLLVGWLWYLGTLVPVIGLVQVGSQAMADRYTYVPLTGLFIIVAWGVPELLAGWHYRKVAIGISAVTALSVLSVCSYLQVGRWRDSLTLFEYTLAAAGDSSTALNNLGNALTAKGKYNEALEYYYRAIKLDCNDFKAHNNLGNTLSLQARIDEAISHYNEAIRINSAYAAAYGNLGIALMAKGRLDEAIDSYRKALQFKPDFLEAHNNLGIALQQQGKFDEAVNHFQQVVQLKPHYAKTHNNLGIVFRLQGKSDEAVSHFEQALKIDPNYAEAHNNLGIALGMQGKFDEAINHFQTALRIRPDSAEAKRNLEIALKLRSQGGSGRTAASPQPALHNDPNRRKIE